MLPFRFRFTRFWTRCCDVLLPFVLAELSVFPACNMALLAEELCVCKAELLSGGLSGRNWAAVIKHLWSGQPVLIPYPAAKWRQIFLPAACSSLTVCAGMMRTSTMSHASVRVTGRTGPLLQVRPCCWADDLKKKCKRHWKVCLHFLWSGFGLSPAFWLASDLNFRSV